MEERSVRIELAGRAYPLTIHTGEEVNVRRAVDEINESIAAFKSRYPLNDKQDLLAMAALEVTVRALNSTAPDHMAEIGETLSAVEKMLSDRRV